MALWGMRYEEFSINRSKARSADLITQRGNAPSSYLSILCPMAKVVQITAENFETEVAQASENRAVAVLFSSAEYPDCAPYSQLLGQLSTSMDFTLGVVSCDERENMQLIQAFRVRSVPEVHIVDS